MKLFRRQLIYVQVHQDHFLARSVGDGRTIRRQCHALGNRAGEIKNFSTIQPQLRSVFSELKSGFSLLRAWGLLHFDPVEYPITKEELAGFKKMAERSGVGFCWLSTWEEPHLDKDLITMFQLSPV